MRRRPPARAGARLRGGRRSTAGHPTASSHEPRRERRRRRNDSPHSAAARPGSGVQESVRSCFHHTPSPRAAHPCSPGAQSLARPLTQWNGGVENPPTTDPIRPESVPTSAIRPRPRQSWKASQNPRHARRTNPGASAAGVATIRRIQLRLVQDRAFKSLCVHASITHHHPAPRTPVHPGRNHSTDHRHIGTGERNCLQPQHPSAPKARPPAQFSPGLVDRGKRPRTRATRPADRKRAWRHI